MSWRGALAVPLFAFGAFVAARRLVDVVEVRGRSMYPTLSPGDRLVLVRRGGAVRAGDVVVAPDPREPSRELVKRVASVGPRGVELRGDNPVASTDGRTFGRVPEAAVQWRATVRYWPVRRFGRIPPPPAHPELGGEDACTVPDALVAGDR
ncbi:MAG: nickel-type superoxide dismutase maturation protease [Chloroflexi bacterium]|nr:nickel-type superoxide dismutase maturation protease [Chloroflexota bacterium]